jgi:hypothetical protein
MRPAKAESRTTRDAIRPSAARVRLCVREHDPTPELFTISTPSQDGRTTTGPHPPFGRTHLDVLVKPASPIEPRVSVVGAHHLTSGPVRVLERAHR